MGSKRNKHQFILARIVYFICILSMLKLPDEIYCIEKRDHHFRNTNNQDPTSDTSDMNSSAGSEGYDPTESSDLREEEPLMPPNELSVIRMNDTSVVLRWEFPEEAQEHILYFKVQHKSTRKNITDWKTDPAEIVPVTRAFQINGLRPGNFLFCVIAVYDNHDNAPSKPLKYRIKARTKIYSGELPEMTAPKIYWNESTSDYFRFKWHYEPKPNDTQDFGYLVYYRSTHIVQDFTIFNTMDSNVEIAELEPDTPYEAKVVAYNMVGISEFSETITIRTKPAKPETTPPTLPSSPIPPAKPTIPPPVITSTTRHPHLPSWTSHDQYETTQKVGGNQQAPESDRGITTPKPMNPISVSNNSTSVWNSIESFFKPIFSDQSDAMLTIRYLLIVLLPSLFVIFGLVFCIRPYRNKKEPRPPSSTDDSQFDLEINGYFKNSFPGVEEKDYPIVTNGVHSGFVNNHPHINDFA